MSSSLYEEGRRHLLGKLFTDDSHGLPADNIVTLLQRPCEHARWKPRPLWYAIGKEWLGLKFLEDQFLIKDVLSWDKFTYAMDRVSGYTLFRLAKDLLQFSSPDTFFELDWPDEFLKRCHITRPAGF